MQYIADAIHQALWLLVHVFCYVQLQLKYLIVVVPHSFLLKQGRVSEEGIYDITLMNVVFSVTTNPNTASFLHKF